MGKYILLEFDNDDQANALCAQINTATAAGKAFRLVGIFKRPGRTCKCPRVRNTYKAKEMAKLGKKYGWWVCSDCHLPRLGGHQLVNMLAPREVLAPYDRHGVDFMSVAPIPQEYRILPTQLHIMDVPTNNIKG